MIYESYPYRRLDLVPQMHKSLLGPVDILVLTISSFVKLNLTKLLNVREIHYRFPFHRHRRRTLSPKKVSHLPDFTQHFSH